MAYPYSPDTPILDDANRPNEGPPPSANWFIPVGGANGLVIDTLKIATDPASAAGGVSMWGILFGPDCEVYTRIDTLQVDGNDAYMFIRSNTINPGSPGWEGYALFIGRNDAGNDAIAVISHVGAVIAPTVITLLAGDSFWFRAVGNLISVYQKHAVGNWVHIEHAINSDAPAFGYIGLGTTDKTIRFGYLGGGTVIPPITPGVSSPPMYTPSFCQQTGLSIIATDSLLAANRSTWFSRLSDQVQTFRMEKRRIGGYWSAQANINMRSDEVEDWIERGLGRHIQVKDEALCVVWEGFVNRIEAKLGKLTFTLGPLMDIANRVQVAYSTVDNTVSPPILGITARTTAVNDLDSQAVYGIIQKILSTGGSTPAEAAQNGNTYLALNAWPPTGRQSTLLGGAAGDLTIELLGYWAWLGAYVYNQTAATGAVNASAKLQAVLAASPNAGLFSTDYSRLTANTVQVSQWEDEDRTAEDVVKAINALGTAAYATTNVGFYTGRQIVYEPAPTSIRYVQRVASNDLLTDLIGGQVKPWNVMPGEWIYYADFLAGRLPPVTGTAIQRDPRCGLIEVVTLDNRYGLDVNGVHVGTLDQMLARQGLAGVGA